MDWSKILRDAGIPEPPGRPELVEQLQREAAIRAANPQQQGASKRKQKQTNGRRRK